MASEQVKEVEEKYDIEAQSRVLATSTSAPAASTANQLLYLGAWFILNLVLTVSNKALLGKARYPWLLSTLHTSATSLGCLGIYAFGSLKLTKLDRRDNLMLMAFSILFTLNIAISNVSLASVSMPLHQILRSTCPAVTMLIYWAFFSTRYSTTTYLSMIPLIIGVGLATIGDYYCTLSGFLLTSLGVILASAKAVATNKLLTGSLALSAMEALLRMSPLAAVQCVVWALLTGEAEAARNAYATELPDNMLVVALLANAAVAFLLNVVSFQTNKVTGALTMTVAGNVKQALTILIGLVFFRVPTGVVNGIGMLLTLAGAAWYSKVELDRKRTVQHRTPSARPHGSDDVG